MQGKPPAVQARQLNSISSTSCLLPGPSTIWGSACIAAWRVFLTCVPEEIHQLLSGLPAADTLYRYTPCHPSLHLFTVRAR